MFLPVLGLRPWRALVCFTLKVPKPESATGSFFFKDLVIELMIAGKSSFASWSNKLSELGVGLPCSS